MKKDNLAQIGAYILAAVVAVGGAFIISLQFIGPTSAQDANAPPPVEAPAADAPPPPPPVEDPAAATPPPPPPVDPAGAPPAGAPPSDPAMNAAQQMPPPLPEDGSSGLIELEGFLEPFIYDMVNRRDPFMAYAEYVPSDDNPSRPLSPAQRFALEELRLVGIMWDVREPKAMFMDPEKEVLMLGRDESIGNRNGYIAAIREGEVVVVESLRKRGEIIYRTRVLRIER